MEDGRPDPLGNGGLIGADGCEAQDQNGNGKTGFAKLQGLGNGTDTEKSTLFLKKPGDGNCAVAVGTGLAVPQEEADEDVKEVKGVRISDGVIELPSGEVLTYTHTGTFKGTAYTHGIGGVDFITATGTTVHWGTVAVDPDVIPYGTRMFIVSNDGEYVYGLSTAEDCGGGVNGYHVDLYFPSVYECFQFGVRECTIYFLGESEIWS